MKLAAQQFTCTIGLILLTHLFLGGTDNSPGLSRLLLAAKHEFEIANISWALEGGTLLGAVRSERIIPHEFDLDLTISQAHFERLKALKPLLLAKYGFTLNTCGDVNYVKGLWKFVSSFGIWDPYIGLNPEEKAVGMPCFPCGRLYDERWYFSADIFCDFEVPKVNLVAHLQLTKSKLKVTDLQEEEVYLCNGNHDRLACRGKADVLPYHQTRLLGMNMPVPRKSELILEQGYGQNWRVPLPLGIKKITSSLTGRIALVFPFICIALQNKLLDAAICMVAVGLDVLGIWGAFVLALLSRCLLTHVVPPPMCSPLLGLFTLVSSKAAGLLILYHAVLCVVMIISVDPDYCAQLFALLSLVPWPMVIVSSKLKRERERSIHWLRQ